MNYLSFQRIVFYSRKDIKKMIKLLTTAIIVLFISANSFAQIESISTNQIILKDNLSSTSQMYVSNQYFDVEFDLEDCDPKYGYDSEFVHLKITNKTSKQIKLSWYMDLYYNGDCKTCSSTDEYFYEVTLQPNEILAGNCDLQSDYQLKMFSKFIDSQYHGGNIILTSFQLRQLQLLFK